MGRGTDWIPADRHTASGRASLLTPHTSYLIPHTSHLILHTSHLTPHTSYFTPHTSHLTPHTSHLIPHTSYFTPHTSYPVCFSPPAIALTSSKFLVNHCSAARSGSSARSRRQACRYFICSWFRICRASPRSAMFCN